MSKINKDKNQQIATGPDKIPPKIIKLSAHIIDSHFINIINKDIDNNRFSKYAKIASVRPIFKKKEREKLKTIDQSAF